MNAKPEPFIDKEKVPILLHEYDTLRAEIIARTCSGFQILAVTAALFVWVIQADLYYKFWAGLGALAIILSIGSWIAFGNINKATSRLRELEKDINARAGETLLVWESQHAGGLTGFWRGIGKPPRHKTPICENRNDLPAESSAGQPSEEK